MLPLARDRNVIKIILTRCQIFHLKCTSSISARAPLQSPLGSSPYPVAGFGEREGKREKERRERGGKRQVTGEEKGEA